MAPGIRVNLLNACVAGAALLDPPLGMTGDVAPAEAVLRRLLPMLGGEPGSEEHDIRFALREYFRILDGTDVAEASRRSVARSLLRLHMRDAHVGRLGRARAALVAAGLHQAGAAA